MKRISPITVLTLFLLGLAFPASGRTEAGNNLHITGTVLSFTGRCIDNEIVPQIGLYLQARNDGTDPIILFSPTFEFEIRAFFDGMGSNGSESNSGITALRYHPNLGNSIRIDPRFYDEYLRQYFAQNDSAVPDSRHTTIIEPGGYHEFTQTIWVKVSSEIIKSERSRAMPPQPDGLQCNDFRVRPDPKHQSFRLEFRLSPKQYGQPDSYFRRLRDRWRDVGNLPLDGNGAVFFRTESIVLPR
jgi:hypothetical protein